MNRFRSVIRIVTNILFGLTIVFLVLVIALLLLCNIGSDGRSLIGNIGFARVATGSMEPEIPTGSFILIEKVDPSTLEISDTITFWSHDPLVPQGIPVSHRIVRIEQENGIRTFTTRGIANDIDDLYPVYDADILGKVIWISPTLGAVIGFAQSPIAFPILIVVLLVCFFINAMTVVKEAKKLSDQSNQAAVAAARDEILQELQQADHAEQPQTDSDI